MNVDKIRKKIKREKMIEKICLLSAGMFYAMTLFLVVVDRIEYVFTTIYTLLLCLHFLVSNSYRNILEILSEVIASNEKKER